MSEKCQTCDGGGSIVGVETEMECCRGSDWECGARGCTGPYPIQVQGGQEICLDCYGSGDANSRFKQPSVFETQQEQDHDEALDRWLKESDFRDDPENAKFFLEANLAAYSNMQGSNRSFNAFEWATERHLDRERISMDRLRFLQQDEELTVKGIELAMHGHVGANGARGSQAAFAKSGRKSIVGHSHSPWQHEGAMGVGVMGALDMGYNKGMSSWSHTFALVYPNGKRTLITIYDDKWRGK